MLEPAPTQEVLRLPLNEPAIELLRREAIDIGETLAPSSCAWRIGRSVSASTAGTW
jgi:hypothetical protein